MQHLVKQNIFDRVARNARSIKDAAYDDGVVRRIIVSEAAASKILTPGKLWTPQKPMKKVAVEVVKKFFKMIMMAAGGANKLSSAHLADEPCFSGNIMTRDITSITGAVNAIDWPAIKLGEQDMRY